MAKDAKGHGSEKHGGITGTSTTHYADNGQTVHRVQWGDGSTTEGGGGAHIDALFNRARREGAPHTESGQPADAAAATMLAGGHPKSGVVPVHGGAAGPQYNREAVNNAIASSNRAGRRIGGKEASAIHRLLKGRH